jgi:hypothetical protein
MRSTKSPIKEPITQVYAFPTELGDFCVYPVFKSDETALTTHIGWSYSPTPFNGGDTWGVLDGGNYQTAREALSAAVLWAQQEYDGPAIPAGVDRVAPHWDRPGTTFNPGGWAYDNFLFHALAEVIGYASRQ